jgi:hypothetical protein
VLRIGFLNDLAKHGRIVIGGRFELVDASVQSIQEDFNKTIAGNASYKSPASTPI